MRPVVLYDVGGAGVCDARVCCASMRMPDDIVTVSGMTMSRVRGTGVSAVSVLSDAAGRHCDEAHATDGQARQINVHAFIMYDVHAAHQMAA